MVSVDADPDSISIYSRPPPSTDESINDERASMGCLPNWCIIRSIVRTNKKKSFPILVRSSSLRSNANNLLYSVTLGCVVWNISTQQQRTPIRVTESVLFAEEDLFTTARDTTNHFIYLHHLRMSQMQEESPALFNAQYQFLWPCKRRWLWPHEQEKKSMVYANKRRARLKLATHERSSKDHEMICC